MLGRYLQARSLKVSQQQGAGGTAAAGPVPQPPRTNKLPPMDSQKNQQTDEILNAILPPRYKSLTIIPRARVGCEMVDSQRSELAIIMVNPTSASGIFVS